MATGFPTKYFFVFSDSPEIDFHRNKIVTGLRIGLTLAMDMREVNVLLLEEAILLAIKQEPSQEAQEQSKGEERKNSSQAAAKETRGNSFQNEDIYMPPRELLEGLIAFGGRVMTCHSTLRQLNITEKDLICGVELISLYDAVRKLEECERILTF